MKTNTRHQMTRLLSKNMNAWWPAMLFLVSAVAADAAIPLVPNGGFETGSFSSWTQSGNLVGSYVVSAVPYVHSGAYGAELGQVTTLGYLSQTLPTAPGQTYLVSFWLWSPGGSPTEFNVAWGGTSLFDAVNLPAAGWSNYVFIVTATSYNTALQFGFRNDPNYFGLDDISVTPIGVGINFDDLPNFSVVTNGYEGLNWNNFSVLNAVTFSGNPSGAPIGLVSSNNVAFNTSDSLPASITTTNSTPFNLFSAYLTATWNDNLQLEVKGYTGAGLVYDNIYTLSATNRTLINFNYLGVTEVDFIASGGTHHASYSAGSGFYFAMDNVNAATGLGVRSGPQIAVPLPGPLSGQSAYVRSALGEPWGVTDNDTAMNQVFGTNVWHDLRYETVNAAYLFSPAMHFIYLEGGENNANALNTFLNANRVAMQSWVSNGGSLFLNAAPNQGGNIDCGFGVTLNYSANQYAPSGSAVNPLNPIFNGPFAPVGTYWTGNSFAHATNSGAGLIPVIVNTNNGSIVLGELSAGRGHALFGGMTVPFYHSPSPQAANLRANIIAYANSSPQATFDDLPPSNDGLAVTNGYRGFYWNNFYSVDGGNNSYNPSGYAAGVISTNNVGYNGYGSPASVTNATPFNFISAYLTAAWNDNLQVEAQGYVGGILAYDQTYTLSATTPTLIVFNYLGVTAVNFISSGGTSHPGYGGGGTQFVMDNVTVLPEIGPQLSIVYTGANTTVVSWPSPSTGWRLQQTSPLSPSSWTTPPETVYDNFATKYIIVNPAVSNQFYRLIYP